MHRISSKIWCYMVFKFTAWDSGKSTGFPKPPQNTAGSLTRPHSAQAVCAKSLLNTSQPILFLLLMKWAFFQLWLYLAVDLMLPERSSLSVLYSEKGMDEVREKGRPIHSVTSSLQSTAKCVRESLTFLMRSPSSVTSMVNPHYTAIRVSRSFQLMAPNTLDYFMENALLTSSISYALKEKRKVRFIL